MREFDISLSYEIEYSSKGETRKASFIKIVAPTAKQLSYCAEIKQAFFQATTSIKTDSTESVKEDSKITGSDILALMYMSKEVDMSKVLLFAKELMTSGVCLIDGEEKLTKTLFDLLDQDDMENLVGEYLVNFTLRSVLKKTN